VKLAKHAHGVTMHYADGSLVAASGARVDPGRKIVSFEGAPTDDLLQETLPYLPELRRIRIDMDRVSERGLEAVLGLDYLDKLALIANRDPRVPRRTLSVEGASLVARRASLSVLMLHNISVGEVAFGQLASLENLRELSLMNTGLTPACFKTISRLPKIERVWIYDEDFNRLADEETLRAIASLDGRLTTLSFGEWGESRIHPSMIPAIAEIESLEWLDLGDPAHFTAADLAPLKKLANLTHFEPHIPPNDDLGKALQELADAANRRSMEKLRERAPTR